MRNASRYEVLDIALKLAKQDENQGVCMQCGEIHDCIEPDARKYKCEACGENSVYGAEEALMILT